MRNRAIRSTLFIRILSGFLVVCLSSGTSSAWALRPQLIDKAGLESEIRSGLEANFPAIPDPAPIEISLTRKFLLGRETHTVVVDLLTEVEGDDLKQLIELRRLFREEQRRFGIRSVIVEDEESSQTWFESHIGDKPDGTILVAARDDTTKEIIGYRSIENSPREGAGVSRSREIYVHPKYSGARIGTAMIRRSLIQLVHAPAVRFLHVHDTSARGKDEVYVVGEVVRDEARKLGLAAKQMVEGRPDYWVWLTPGEGPKPQTAGLEAVQLPSPDPGELLLPYLIRLYRRTIEEAKSEGDFSKYVLEIGTLSQPVNMFGHILALQGPLDDELPADSFLEEHIPAAFQTHGNKEWLQQEATALEPELSIDPSGDTLSVRLSFPVTNGAQLGLEPPEGFQLYANDYFEASPGWKAISDSSGIDRDQTQARLKRLFAGADHGFTAVIFKTPMLKLGEPTQILLRREEGAPLDVGMVPEILDFMQVFLQRHDVKPKSYQIKRQNYQVSEGSGLAVALTVVQFFHQPSEMVSWSAEEDADPETPEDFLDRALDKRERGDKEGGVADLWEAVQLDPEYLDGWWMLGLFLMTLDQREKGLEAFETAYQLAAEGGISARFDRPIFDILDIIGSVLLQEGDPVGAIERYKKAISRDPENLAFVRYLAGLYGYVGNAIETGKTDRLKKDLAEPDARSWFKLAVDLYGQCCEREPRDILSRIFIIHYGNKTQIDLPGRAADLEKNLRKNPEDPLLWFEWSDALLQLELRELMSPEVPEWAGDAAELLSNLHIIWGVIFLGSQALEISLETFLEDEETEELIQRYDLDKDTFIRMIGSAQGAPDIGAPEGPTPSEPRDINSRRRLRLIGPIIAVAAQQLKEARSAEGSGQAVPRFDELNGVKLVRRANKFLVRVGREIALPNPSPESSAPAQPQPEPRRGVGLAPLDAQFTLERIYRGIWPLEDAHEPEGPERIPPSSELNLFNYLQMVLILAGQLLGELDLEDFRIRIRSPSGDLDFEFVIDSDLPNEVLVGLIDGIVGEFRDAEREEALEQPSDLWIDWDGVQLEPQEDYLRVTITVRDEPRNPSEVLSLEALELAVLPPKSDLFLLEYLSDAIAEADAWAQQLNLEGPRIQVTSPSGDIDEQLLFNDEGFEENARRAIPWLDRIIVHHRGESTVEAPSDLWIDPDGIQLEVQEGLMLMKIVIRDEPRTRVDGGLEAGATIRIKSPKLADSFEMPQDLPAALRRNLQDITTLEAYKLLELFLRSSHELDAELWLDETQKDYFYTADRKTSLWITDALRVLVKDLMRGEYTVNEMVAGVAWYTGRHRLARMATILHAEVYSMRSGPLGIGIMDDPLLFPPLLELASHYVDWDRTLRIRNLPEDWSFSRTTNNAILGVPAGKPAVTPPTAKPVLFEYLQQAMIEAGWWLKELHLGELRIQVRSPSGDLSFGLTIFSGEFNDDQSALLASIVGRFEAAGRAEALKQPFDLWFDPGGIQLEAQQDHLQLTIVIRDALRSGGAGLEASLREEIPIAEAAQVEAGWVVVMGAGGLESPQDWPALISRFDKFLNHFILVGDAPWAAQLALENPGLRIVQKPSSDAITAALRELPEVSRVTFFGSDTQAQMVRTAANVLGLEFDHPLLSLALFLNRLGVAPNLAAELAAGLESAGLFARQL